MARETSSTFNSVLATDVEVYNNGVLGSKTTSYSQHTDLVSATTRSDVQKTPKGEFRAPLPYSAVGYHKETAYVDSKGYIFTNAGRRQTFSHFLGTYATNGFMAVASRPISLITMQERERTLVDLLNNVGDQKWSMGQALIEGREAVSLIGKTANTLARAFNLAKRKRFKQMAKTLGVQPIKLKSTSKDAASAWIQYSFAWVPLVEDMAYAALYLGGHLDNEKFLIMARAKKSRSSVSTKTGAGSLSSGSQVHTFTWNEEAKATTDLKMSLYYEVDRKGLRDLAEIGIVGLSTPWAVMPHSYLVDWVLPIGDILAALDATIGLTYLGGSYTTFSKNEVFRTQKDFTRVGRGVLESSIILWNPAVNFDMERTVYKTNPIPIPVYYKNPLDPWKTVMAISLLRQSFKT